METENSGTENKLVEQEAPRKSGRPPPIIKTSTANLIQLQSNLKTTSKKSTSSHTYEMEPVS
jgi:hypothetical protein